MARLQAVSEQFRIAKQGTLAETQKILVRVAKEENARIMATEPRPTRFKRFVDGRVGTPEEAVKPDGVILYQYPRLDVVVEFAMETLREKSPVGPPEGGHYRDAHTLFINGSPAALEALASLPDGATMAIANFMPYARKIEAGKMKMTVPGSDHVYQQAAQIVNGRYGNVAKVRFTYRGIEGGGIIGGHAGNKSGARFPALTFSER